MNNRIDVFKPTDDDWYPSYQLYDLWDEVKNQTLVRVSFLGNISPPGRMPVFRVCAWGNDDFGMELDLTEEALAFNIFLQIIGKNVVNRQDLKEFGFISA